MVSEDYVSFETAKLLKEKGFMDGAMVKFFASGYDKYGNILPIQATELNDYPRPTLQMTMKWLRAIHKIDITIDPHDVCGSWIYQFHLCHNREYLFSRDVDTTYEGTCEAAIKHCLENLI